MNFDLVKGSITPAEDEHSVRTYFCTYYKSWLLGLEARGYLGITNKRVIFHATGSSNVGKSVIQSEVPIADISGISSFKGFYFSIGHLFAALFASAAVGGIVGGLLTLLGLVADTDTFNVIGWIFALVSLLASFLISKNSIFRTILAGAATVIFSLLGSGSLINSFDIFNGPSYSGTWIFALAVAAGIIMLVFLVMYAKRPTFSLAICSKGGSSTPISISGASGIGIFNASAGKALNAEPADEAEPMLKELGAIIMDIQTLGDIGIAKWKNL